MGSLIDFSTFFSYPLRARQSHLLSSIRACLSSACKLSDFIVSVKSRAVFYFLSLASLEAPLVNKALNGLPLFRVSELFTARWRAVYPSQSSISS